MCDDKCYTMFATRISTTETYIYTIILLKSVCQRSQSAGRNSCLIISGNVSNCSYRLTNPIGHDLHRHCWVRLNRMITGYGRLGQQMVRMGLATDPSCSCGCAVQTAHHAIYDCPITRCPGDFTTLDLRARDWLHTTQLNM